MYNIGALLTIESVRIEFRRVLYNRMETKIDFFFPNVNRLRLVYISHERYN